MKRNGRRTESALELTLRVGVEGRERAAGARAPKRRQRVPGFGVPLPAPVIVGLDLSLRFTCAVAVPGDWSQDWSRVEVMARSGESLRADCQEFESIRRIERIEADVVAFVRRVQASHVFIEQYAYSADMSRAHALGELGGVVKVALQRDCKLPIVMVSPRSARTLLGKQPFKGGKEWAAEQLKRAGAPRDWVGPAEDRNGVYDAFACANWGLSQCGGEAIVMQQELRFAKRRRKEARA